MSENTLNCRSYYDNVKSSILKSEKNNIVYNIQDFIKIIDYCDGKYWDKNHIGVLPSSLFYGNSQFNSSVKELLRFLLQNYPSEWIDSLLAELLGVFEKIKENNKNNFFKLFNYIEKLADENRELYDLVKWINNFASEKFLFLVYLFILSVQEIESKTCIEKIALKAKGNFTINPEDKFLTTWIITETLIGSKKVGWEDKKEFFWEWDENPYFSLFNDEKTFVNFEVIDNIGNSKQGGFESLDNHFIYNFLQLLHSFEKKASDEEKQLFREKILKNITLYFQNKSQDFLRIIKRPFQFSEIYNWLDEYKRYQNVFSSFNYLNKLLPGIIPIEQKERAMIEETIHIYDFVNSFENDIYDLKASTISKHDPLDFIFETKNDYKIGLELIRYEKEEEFQKRASGVSCLEPRWTPDIPNTHKQFIEQLKDKIRKKILKCEKYNEIKQNLNLNELWLYLHPSIISKTFLDLAILDNLDKDFREKTKNQIRNLIYNEKDNCFDKIYSLLNNKPILLFKKKHKLFLQ